MLYKAFIFDFFGVICSGVGDALLANNMPESDANDFKNSFFRATDIGALSEQDFFVQAGDLVKRTPAKVRDEWLSLARINVDMVEIIRELKKTHRIALCSNSPSPFIREIIARDNIGGLFDQIIISSEVGLVKPDSEIYALTLEKLAVNTHEAVYVDDSKDNVIAAEQLGMKGIIFSSVEKFIREIQYVKKAP